MSLLPRTAVRLAMLCACLAALGCESWGLSAGRQAYDSGDYDAALQTLEPLAKGGNSLARTYLALMYDKGSGVSQDPAEAAKWRLLAAEQGNASAQYGLAEIEEAEGLAAEWMARRGSG